MSENLSSWIQQRLESLYEIDEQGGIGRKFTSLFAANAEITVNDEALNVEGLMNVIPHGGGIFNKSEVEWKMIVEVPGGQVAGAYTVINQMKIRIRVAHVQRKHNVVFQAKVEEGKITKFIATLAQGTDSGFLLSHPQD